MKTPAKAVDVETLYRYVQEQAWTPALDLLYRHRTLLAIDPLWRHAAALLIQELHPRLPELSQAVLEQLFLLHTGRLYPLPEAVFADLVAELVRRHANRPEVARRYARWCPTHPECARLLETPASSVAWEDWNGFAVQQHMPTQPATPPSLFRSEQEFVFFQAVRDVFPTYLVYPNVALSCLIDYERMADLLNASERRYVLRALVDCVVFDPNDAYRPRYCFELDSPLHAEPARRRRDVLKARVLQQAGLPLYRIRPPSAAVERDAFVMLLRRLFQQKQSSAS
ncbi:DUF2726 domain-containing protein [Rhodothermus profundi]|uniref:DUF2726 domain-containing protein n=1 Tax=Rhodothermus profundi TaxID=633813 RepID=A0A1M6VV09_9BACT|nr:DUF2726 domain-containing protein [Rhodothermus profundi]SHK85382.1 Protein of unknown function [Rhodothermus profundi]